MNPVDISAVQSDRVRGLSGAVLIGQEVVRQLRRARHLAGALQAQHQQVQHQPVVLHYERRELEAADDTVRVCVVHVLWKVFLESMKSCFG